VPEHLPAPVASLPARFQHNTVMCAFSLQLLALLLLAVVAAPPTTPS
jgi:hypothetical protein